MSLQQLLQQIMQSSQGAASSGRPGQGGLGQKISEQASGFGGGAVVGGLLGMLLGNKKFRKMGGSMAGYGGAAALGALALKVYQNWQTQNAGQEAQPAPVQAVPVAPLPLHSAPSPTADTHAMVILAALVSAAKADGHIGEPERQLIEGEIAKLPAPEQARLWLSKEVLKPVDPQAVASLAQTPEMAAEIYLASLVAIDEQSYMERAYLDELARLMSLPDSLRKSLDNQLQPQTQT